MHEFIVQAIAAGGYLGIFVLMALENIFPPMPSEVIMGIGGMLVERGEMDFWPLLLIGTLGTTAGNYPWFWLGRKGGGDRLRRFIDRWGRWLTLDWEHVAAAIAFFSRHGPWVVFLMRFSPFMRTLISLPAGLARMNVWTFLAFTFAGSLAWNGALIWAGGALQRWLAESQHVLGWIITGAVALAIAAYFWRLMTWTPRAERERP